MSGINHYKSLKKSFKAQLSEDSDNSIQNTIQSLAWNDCIYRTFNEGLRLAERKNRMDRIPNTLVEYIHHAHISYVVITLRKLYENKKNSSRAVNSVRTISQRLLDNHHLLTRNNYLTHDDSPYDDQSNFDWRMRLTIQGRHKQFDKLCGLKVENKRKPDDRIQRSLLEVLHKSAVLHQNIEQFANKFLAHASAQANRPEEDLIFEKMKLISIQNQYRNLIWAVKQIAKIVDEVVITEVPGLPMDKSDVLKNWDNSLFDHGIKSKLQRYWDMRANWWQKWSDYYQNSSTLFLSPRKKQHPLNSSI